MQRNASGVGTDEASMRHVERLRVARESEEAERVEAAASAAVRQQQHGCGSPTKPVGPAFLTRPHISESRPEAILNMEVRRNLTPLRQPLLQDCREPLTLPGGASARRLTRAPAERASSCFALATSPTWSLPALHVSRATDCCVPKVSAAAH